MTAAPVPGTTPAPAIRAALAHPVAILSPAAGGKLDAKAGQTRAAAAYGWVSGLVASFGLMLGDIGRLVTEEGAGYSCTDSSSHACGNGRTVIDMDQQNAVGEFLHTRRDRITPQQAGILGGTRRRVPGLRREEVATLAGVSVEYYARMERGDLRGVSAQVLDSLARTLCLDEAETDHLHALAEAAGPQPARRRKASGEQPFRPSLQRFIDAIAMPVWVRDRRMDFVAGNAQGRELYAPLLEDQASQGNTARFMFFNPAARVFFPDWEQNASGIVASLRTYAGQNPRDKRLTDLIGELVTRSDDFRLRWAAHEVRHHRAGIKRIHHPEVGDLELVYEAMDFPANPEWFMFGYTAEPGTPSEERLQLLGSLAAATSRTDHKERA